MTTSVKPLNNEQAANLIGIKPITLRIWRVHGKGPNFVKLGDNKRAGVVYFESDVLTWLEARKFSSTSAYSPAGVNSTKSSNLRSPPASV